MGISGLFFFIFHVRGKMFNKECWWLHSNPGPRVLEAIKMSTVLQPILALVYYGIFFAIDLLIKLKYSDTSPQKKQWTILAKSELIEQRYILPMLLK